MIWTTFTMFLIAATTSVPDLIIMDCGSIKMMSGQFHNNQPIINVANIGDDGKRNGVGIGRFGGGGASINCRFANSSGRLWVLEIGRRNSSNLFGAEVTQFKTSELQSLLPWGRLTSYKGMSSPGNPKGEAGPTDVRVILDRLTAAYLNRKVSPPIGDSSQWKLNPYWEMVRKLSGGDLPSDVQPYPMGTIAAISANKAIIPIYACQRISWLELEELPIGSDFDGKAKIDGSRFLKPVIGPLAIKSIGATDTSIDTWATACWIKGAVHLISDDGKYERFVLKDGLVAAAGRLALANPPKAICQGRSRLWSLSEKEGTVRAAEISWDESGAPSQKEREFGKMSLEKVGWQLLTEDKDAK